MSIHSVAEERVAERYRAAGYQVVSGPHLGPIEIPGGFFEPDLVATRGEEKVVIEVLDSNARRKGSLGAAAEAMRARGWRLDVVPASGVEEAADARLLLAHEIDQRIQLASNAKILDIAPDIALLIAWTAFESVISSQIEELGGAAAPVSPNQLLKEAASLGLIEQGEFDELKHIGRMRNLVAHGRASASISPDEVSKLLGYIEIVRARAVRQSEHSDDGDGSPIAEML